MNKPLLLSLVFFLFVAKSIFGQSWNSGSIKGEGEIVRQEISLGAIKGIDLGFSGDIILTHGSTQMIVIEGQQNVIDNIKREIKDGTWHVNYIRNVKEAKPVVVYITLPTIDRVSLSGSGSIRSTGKFTRLGEMEVAVSGSGDITLDLEARETDLRVSGSGKIRMSGSTNEMNIAISGSGDVFANDFTSSACKVRISGSGDAQVQVNGELETQISGSGDVHYTGNANVKAKISGSGEVSKL